VNSNPEKRVCGLFGRLMTDHSAGVSLTLHFLLEHLLMKLHSVITIVAPVFLAACGISGSSNSSKDGGGSSVAGPTGCVQGVVVDGRSQDRIKLPAHDRSTRTGIFVLLRNELIQATPATMQQDADRLDGEYALCGIPLDETLPIFAWVDGYEPFQSHVRIDSKHLHKFKKNSPADDDSTYEGTLEERSVPVTLANIRMFRVGENTKDLSVFVRNAAKPVAGARVELRPLTFDSAFDDQRQIGANYFLTPSPERLKKITTTTGEDGHAVFAAADLVVGASYEYLVFGDATGDSYIWERGQLTIGLLPVRGDESPSATYVVNVDIADSAPVLKLISRSTDHQIYNETGDVVLVFNRPVELVPGTEDQLTAGLSDIVDAQMADDVANNGRADRVRISIDGAVVTLSPVYKSGGAPLRTREPGAKLTYSGLQLRPAQNALKSLSLWSTATEGGITVSLFGGVTPPM
jgi:hypothetical protein